MNVLSLFDGMSCGQIALERAGVRVDKYFASEIKKIGIKVTMENYPNTIQIGDVTKVWYKDGVLHSENGEWEIDIDLLIGGSPCQDFSIIKLNGDGLRGSKSALFYEWLRIKNEVNPKYFLLENVKMNPVSEFELNCYVGVVGLHINSSLVSFQKDLGFIGQTYQASPFLAIAILVFKTSRVMIALRTLLARFRKRGFELIVGMMGMVATVGFALVPMLRTKIRWSA